MQRQEQKIGDRAKNDGLIKVAPIKCNHRNNNTSIQKYIVDMNPFLALEVMKEDPRKKVDTHMEETPT